MNKYVIKYLLLSLIPLITLIGYINILNKTPMGWDDVTVVNGVVEKVKPGGSYSLAGVIKGDRILNPDKNKNSNFDHSSANNPFIEWTPYVADTPYIIAVERNQELLLLTIQFKSFWSTDKLFFILYHIFI